MTTLRTTSKAAFFAAMLVASMALSAAVARAQSTTGLEEAVKV